MHDTPSLSRRFIYLATREALGSILPDELKELEKMDSYRLRANLSEPELAAEKTRRDKFEHTLSALKEHAGACS